MPASVRSFAKINVGLRIGARRADGFHELRTVYQTVSLHDTVRVDVQRGIGIEIRCKDPRVPADETNTCWRVAERVLKASKARGKIVITIDKQLPVQGGIGAASSNAVATLLGLERQLNLCLEPEQRLQIAAEVGSDLALFLVGGAVLGCGRGEQVYPLEDLPALPLVLAFPAVGVSTPQAFAAWDQKFAGAAEVEGEFRKSAASLTGAAAPATMDTFSRGVFAWLTARLPRAAAGSTAGVPAIQGSPTRSERTQGEEESGGRAEIPGSSEGEPETSPEVSSALLDLVRAGIENDFERVVFPQHPELREVKRELERAGARYASLSGSGSTVYGLFDSGAQAEAAAARLSGAGTVAVAAKTLPRQQYWAKLFIL